MTAFAEQKGPPQFEAGCRLSKKLYGNGREWRKGEVSKGNAPPMEIVSGGMYAGNAGILRGNFLNQEQNAFLSFFAAMPSGIAEKCQPVKNTSF